MAILPRRTRKPGNSFLRNRHGSTWIVVLLVLAGLLLVGGIIWYLVWANRADTDAAPILHTVERGLFNHVVSEQGEVESSKNIELRCEVKARTGSGPSTSIIRVVAEGTEVKEGDELVVLDSSSLEQERDRQEIVVNSSVALVDTAQNTYEAALIAKEEYLNGTYLQAEQTAKSAIFVAEENLRRSKQYAKYSERLAAKGYLTALALEGDLFAVEKATIELETARTNLKVLQELTKKKTEKTFDSDIATAKSKWDSEKKSHNIELRKLAEIESQIAKCVIKAPSAGQVVYANITSSRGGSSEFVVEPGAMVREQQAILRLPDAEFMQVKAKVNESRITLVKAGMPVVIKCDALEKDTLAGEVTRVNPYAEPTSYFGSPVKVYSTFIRIFDPPADIRTGLTAQVSIQVDRRENVLQIPMQAVVEHGTKTYCLVMGPNKRLEPREIQIGASNDKFVMIEEDVTPDALVRKVADDGIKQGLAVDEQVVMNPRDYLHRIKLPEPPSVAPEQTAALKKAEESAAKRKAEGKPATPADGPDAGRPRDAESPGSGGERPRGNRRNPAEFFASLDKDGNGKISKGELPSFLVDRVGEADTNGDGDLDRGEFTAAMAKMRPPGGGGSPPGGGPPGGGP
jgi:HlyD family secretion protein